MGEERYSAMLRVTTFSTFASENSAIGAERSGRELEDLRGCNKPSYFEALNWTNGQ
jgi:hypothetical protein